MVTFLATTYHIRILLLLVTLHTKSVPVITTVLVMDTYGYKDGSV